MDSLQFPQMSPAKSINSPHTGRVKRRLILSRNGLQPGTMNSSSLTVTVRRISNGSKTETALSAPNTSSISASVHR